MMCLTSLRRRCSFGSAADAAAAAAGCDAVADAMQEQSAPLTKGTHSLFV